MACSSVSSHPWCIREVWIALIEKGEVIVHIESTSLREIWRAIVSISREFLIGNRVDGLVDSILLNKHPPKDPAACARKRA